MARVLSLLKGEIGYSLVTGVATAADQELYTIIDTKQQWLSSMYDWPFLENRSDVVVNASQRFPTLPTDIIFERSVDVSVAWTNVWLDVIDGIGMSEYNQLSSGDAGIPVQPQDPIQRWRFNSETAFEVWPVPVTQQVVRFTGQRPLTSLLTAGAYDPTKTLDLDDMLVMLFAAAEKLSRMKSQDSQLKLTQAQNRLNMLRASYPTRKTAFRLGPKELVSRPKPASMVVVVAHG